MGSKFSISFLQISSWIVSLTTWDQNFSFCAFKIYRWIRYSTFDTCVEPLSKTRFHQKKIKKVSHAFFLISLLWLLLNIFTHMRWTNIKDEDASQKKLKKGSTCIIFERCTKNSVHRKRYSISFIIIIAIIVRSLHQKMRPPWWFHEKRYSIDYYYYCNQQEPTCTGFIILRLAPSLSGTSLLASRNFSHPE